MTHIELCQGYEWLREFVQSLPALFRKGEGRLIHKGRNELRCFRYHDTEVVVKSFHTPHPINQIVYGTLRRSKAMRSLLNAQMLLRIGIDTPYPIGYMNVRKWGLLKESYLITQHSRCTHTYGDILSAPQDYDDVLSAVGLTVAHLHDSGHWHKDLSRGNILFRREENGTVRIEFIDLNRMGHGRVDMRKGCCNFERLPATPHMHRIIAKTYAEGRGFDYDQCLQTMVEARQRDKNNEEY